MAWGVIAGAILLLRLFVGPAPTTEWALLILGILAGAVLVAPNHFVKGREIMALLSACCFPAIGLCGSVVRGLCCSEMRAQREDPAARKQALAGAFRGYARITLWTVFGIILIVGLLSGRLFLLKVDEFLGVKLVLVTPVVLTAAYYWLGLAELPADAPWTDRRHRISAAVNRILSQPLLLGQVILGVVVLTVLAFFVARSGNDPGVSVSPLELHVRALLDKYLLVRPRTKEFLIGHPALFFGLAAAASGRFRRWVVPLVIIGSIGQSSLLDTFCHLHTPLYLSMLRGTIGWVLGAVVGLIAFLILCRFANSSDAPSPNPSHLTKLDTNGEVSEAPSPNPSPASGRGELQEFA
jgi:hypothetical protein